MVANTYILEYVTIGIFTTLSLVCGVLMFVTKNQNNNETLQEMLKHIDILQTSVVNNNNIYLNKIKNLQDIIYTITENREIDNKFLENKIVRYVEDVEDEIKFVQDNMANSFNILTKPILHFGNVEPKIKQIIDGYIDKNSADTGAFQGWIGKSTFENYSLETTIVKKELKTFKENELWITNPINPDGINLIVRMIFSCSFTSVIFPFYDVKWDSSENTMTLTSKMYEWNGSSDITMKFTFEIIPEKTTEAYSSWLRIFILNSESIFKNIVWEHTLIDI